MSTSSNSRGQTSSFCDLFLKLMSKNRKFQMNVTNFPLIWCKVASAEENGLDMQTLNDSTTYKSNAFLPLYDTVKIKEKELFCHVFLRI